ncbi:hypothetical protein K7432_012449 [Basidiobolus ranarum]|uniref:Cyclase n=1 Tax=Basidiobolus ranarum TaxID=34480 RepID=A0ABR2VS95_9FUNG
MDLPKFKDLPLAAGGPERSAWNVFGKDDELGTLNLLTSETALNAASSSIKTGEFFSLNWSLELPEPPLFNRSIGTKKVVSFAEVGAEYVMDDIYYDMNTQASTQWDGLRHVGNSKLGAFYNGVKRDEILDPDNVGRLGIHNVARKGIAGRGVLLDFKSYADKKGIKFSPGDSYAIKLADLKAIVAEKQITFIPGDILVIHTGWIEWYEALPSKEREIYASKQLVQSIGVEQSIEMLEWIWDSRFAAVASDAPAFERFPAPPGEMLHESILALFGMPIGEFFDVQKLAQRANELGRWNFFLTSAPLNRFGGVASPANALGIL